MKQKITHNKNHFPFSAKKKQNTIVKKLMYKRKMGENIA